VLRHSGAGRTAADISEHEGAPNPSSPEADQYIEVLQSALEEDAQDDANGFPEGTIQTYMVYAYFGGRKKPSARWPMRMAPESDEAIMGESEPPTSEGLVRQLMRHNEGTMKAANLGLTTIMGQMTNLVQQVSAQNEYLMAERMETIKLVEEMHSQKHERELSAFQHMQRAELMRDGVNKASAIIPHLVNKLAGKNLLKAADPTTIALRQLMTTLKPHQLQGILAQLEPEQQIALGAVLEPFAGEGNEEGGNGDAGNGH
jgi:hypothetical protein